MMKNLFKLASKFHIKYGEDPKDPLEDVYDAIRKHDEENGEEAYDSYPEEYDYYIKKQQEEAAKKVEQERQQKSQTIKNAFTAQDAAVIVNSFLSEMRKKFPDIKGVTFSFTSNMDVSATATDVKLAASLTRQFKIPMSLALRKYLLDNKKVFNIPKVSFSI